MKIHVAWGKGGNVSINDFHIGLKKQGMCSERVSTCNEAKVWRTSCVKMSLNENSFPGQSEHNKKIPCAPKAEP